MKNNDANMHNEHHVHMLVDFRNRFFVSLVITLPILLLSKNIQNFLGFELSFTGDTVLLFLLSSIVYLYGGMPFLRGFIEELMAFKPGMMTLIAIAITISYLYSSFVLLGLEGSYLFVEFVTLIDVMLLGHWIEMRSIAVSKGALSKLAKLMPTTAHLLLDDGSTKEVSLSELRKGNKVLIKPGEKVPADGVVIDGESEINESSLTGESKPIAKFSGESVIGGSVNGLGALTVEVMASGKESYISRVIHMVGKAMMSKSRAQDVADNVALALTIIALFSAILTFSVWFLLKADMDFVLERVVSVMVITCPHALGLAIPLVIMRSTGLAARLGLLIRNRVAFEKTSRAQVIVFDKTGTLTEGKFKVSDIVSLGEWTEEEIIRKAASVESGSKHSLADSILLYAKEKGIAFPFAGSARTLPGRGAIGDVDGEDVFIGNLRLMETIEGPAIKQSIKSAKKTAKKIAMKGKGSLFVATKNKVEAVLGLVDVIRPAAYKACKELKKQGFELAMMTGDNNHTAKAVAKELGIEIVFSEVLPNKKAAQIKSLQKIGRTVVMVGDGINDAPALVQADVGIAIGAGTDIAIESADIVLVRNDLNDLMRAINLSKKSRRKIIQNIVWATAYNVAAIPAAAGVAHSYGLVLSPAIGAAIMALSTLIVVINSRLMY